MSDVQPRAQPWKPSHNRWAIAVVVTFAAFMEILDTTIVNVSLPHIAGGLSVSYDEATWTLTSYLVANGIVITISGWLATVFGRKRYFLICLAMFTVASFFCGTATSISQLVMFRLCQGFFGGGLQPSQQSIILDTFPPERRAAAFGVTAIATVVAPVLGPTLGGFITDTYNWRWVFYINIPIGIVAVFFVSFLVEDPPWLKRRFAGVDYIGLALITIGIGCLQVMMDRGETEDWFGSKFIQLAALLAVLGILGAIGWLLIAEKPIVNLDVFKNKNFTMGCVFISIVGGTLYASAVVIPQFAQTVLGYTALWAGMVLSPGGIAVIVLIPIVNVLMKFVQCRYIIGAGFFIMGSAFLYSTNLTPDINFGTLVIMRSFQAAGLAFLFVPISTITFSTIPRELNGDATALYTVFRNIFGSIGISLASAAVIERTQVHQSYLAQWTTPLYQPFEALIAQYQRALIAMGYAVSAARDAAIGRVYQVYLRQAEVLAYNDIFYYVTLIAFAAVPLSLFLSRMKGGAGAAPH
ncbi:MAG TPA: DHA2 family efflux MFS transporter permease subunit [Methylocella sp.]|nr:DHA2 family efflux MFS transporter permease subunit [Methylocella sp.]